MDRWRLPREFQSTCGGVLIKSLGNRRAGSGRFFMWHSEHRRGERSSCCLQFLNRRPLIGCTRVCVVDIFSGHGSAALTNRDARRASALQRTESIQVAAMDVPGEKCSSVLLRQRNLHFCRHVPKNCRHDDQLLDHRSLRQRGRQMNTASHIFRLHHGLPRCRVRN